MGGWVGAGVAVRISEIFLYKDSGKCFFFYKEIKYKKKHSGGWEGRGWGVARVSDFFSFFFKRILV